MNNSINKNNKTIYLNKMHLFLFAKKIGQINMTELQFYLSFGCDTCLSPRCLFDLILYIPSTIFQLNKDGSSWGEPVLS